MKRLSLAFLPLMLSLATDIERDTLKNGLVVLMVEAHRITAVEMRAYVRAGSVFDPVGEEGLANLVSQSLVRGTERFSYDEIVESIESVGGVLAPFASEDYCGLNGKVLSDDLPLLIDIISDCLQHPSFDSLELFRLKRETVSSIIAQKDDPFTVCEKGFRSLLFGDHPLGHFPEGFDTSVATISAGDLKAFHDKYYHPNNTFLVFVGDFDKDSLMAMLNKSLGAWARSELPNMDIATPGVIDHPRAKMIPMDISQVYILLGNFGPELGISDWPAARVMNYIFGGAGLTSRMSWSVREKKGLAYIAFSSFRRFLNGGYLAAEVQTKKDMVDEAVRTMLDEMEKMRDTVGVAELHWAKKFYTGYLPLAYDTYNEMADVVAQIEIEHLGLDYLARFEEYINALTIGDIEAAARKYLHPDRFCLLIVGDAKPEDVKVEGVDWMQ